MSNIDETILVNRSLPKSWTGPHCGKRNRMGKYKEEEFIEFLNIYNNQKDIFKGNIRVGIPLQGNDQHKCNAGISKMVIKYDGLVLPCPAFKEYDIKLLNKLGIKTPNIYNNLEDIKKKNGSMQKPLCKRLYKFNRSIK